MFCSSCWGCNQYYSTDLRQAQALCIKRMGSEIEMEQEKQDHKPYYEDGRKYEPRKVISDWGLNFNLGNAVKYISRAGRKDPQTKMEDLKKVIQYIKYELEEIENENN